jgi:hypothetical protein
MNIFKTSISLFVLILLTSCASSAVWVNKDFDTIIHNVNTISVMPPQVEYFERTTGPTESKPEHNIEVSENTQVALNEVLQEAGYVVKPIELTDSILANNKNLALCLTRSQKRFSRICDSISRLKIKKETYKMDPEIGIIADRADVDYLLFSRGKAYGTSGGAKVADVAFGVLANVLGTHTSTSPRAWDGLSLELLLVDVNTAEAIWYNRDSKMAELNPFELEPVKRHCKSLLSNKLL